MWIMCAPMSLFFSVVGLIQTAYWLYTGDATASPCMDFILESMITYFWAEMLWYGTLYFHETAMIDLWIHHVIYIVMLSLIKECSYSGMARSFLLLEIPTFIRAFGTLVPAYRSDTLFNATFIVFRIVWPFIPTLLLPITIPAFYIVPVIMQTGHFYWLYMLVTRPPKNLANE